MSEKEHRQFTSACAACKFQRKKCSENCVLAPYFPSDDLHKFATAHRIFGTNNIIKTLQDLPTDQRGNAVNSMVYEATARLQDPVYGCAGVISKLQKKVSGLQSELEGAQAELLNLRSERDKLLGIISSFDNGGGPVQPSIYSMESASLDIYGGLDDDWSSDDADPLQPWELLWT
eukprot:Gb_16914 [translate_table: standard]